VIASPRSIRTSARQPPRGESLRLSGDIGFTTNFLPDGSYCFNLVQCRPLQAKGGGHIVAQPEAAAGGDLVLKTQGAVIGPSMAATVGRPIYVVPSVYGQLPLSDHYSNARPS